MMASPCLGKVILIFSLLLHYVESMAAGVQGRTAYPEGSYKQPPSNFTYDQFPPQHLFRRRSSYRLVRRLGAGKFSDVFEAVDEEMARSLKNGTGDSLKRDWDGNDALVVIKCLKPVPERKIIRELLVLSHVAHLPGMARLIGVCWGDDDEKCGETCEDTNKNFSLMPAIILHHAGPKAQWLCHGSGVTDDFSNNTKYLSEFEIKYYLFQLLRSLDSLHSHGIMHRDIKPRNVLITRSTEELNSPNNQLESRVNTKRSLMLIDFGLADFYLPGQSYNVRVASRHYKAPELLINYELYDYSMDLWSVGCILAGLLLRREPFFRGRDNVDQLRQIASILGGTDLLEYCNKLNVTLSPELNEAVRNYQARRPWLTLVSHGCPAPERQALDLLDKLLVYDHTQRLTAAEAMNHSYFDDVRCFDNENKDGEHN